MNFDAISLSGVDQAQDGLGAVTAGQVTKGSFFSAGAAREAILSRSYAGRKNIALGDSVKLGGRSFKVVGLASAPLGGQASDVYLKLAQLQTIADRKGRVNTLYVRATARTGGRR